MPPWRPRLRAACAVLQLVLTALVFLLLPDDAALEGEAAVQGYATVATAYELRDTFADPNVYHITLTADISLEDLLPLDRSHLDVRAEADNQSLQLLPNTGGANGILGAGEAAENGTLLETDMTFVEPVVDVVGDVSHADTMAWRAFRHNTLYSWLPPVERALTLEGACTDGSSKVSCVLNAGGVNRIMAVVANGNITVSDIEFRAGATVPLPRNKSVTFEDLEVEHLGSAVLMGYLGTGRFIRCKFSSNSADSEQSRLLSQGRSPGGAVGLQGSGTVVLESCTFQNNSASAGPSDVVAQAYSTLVVNRCIFLWSDSSVGTYSIGLYPLGTVFRTSISMYNSEFRSSGSKAGGGLYIGGGAIGSVVDTRMIRLKADGKSTSGPITVRSQARVYFSNIHVRDCLSVGEAASAIHVSQNSEVELHNSDISSNVGNLAAIVVEGSKVNVMGTSMNFNKAQRNGSCVAARKSVVQIHSSTLSGGTAARGGCVWATGGLLYVWKSQVVNCSASGLGGGIMLDNLRDSARLTMGALYQTEVTGCTASIGGGGILAVDVLDISTPVSGVVVEQRVNLVMSSCQFRNNTVGGFGGAVLATAASIFLDDSVFSDNYAGVAGNDLWLREASLIMSGVSSGVAARDAFSACELVAFDDSCDVFDEAIPESRELRNCNEPQEPLTTCSPATCSSNQRSTWPPSSGCMVQNAEPASIAALGCRDFQTLEGYEFILARKFPPRSCGDIRCDTRNWLQIERCMETCAVESEPDIFADLKGTNDGSCPGTQLGNFSFGMSTVTEAFAPQSSNDSTIADAGSVSLALAGVVAMRGYSDEVVVNDVYSKATTYEYGNYNRLGKLCLGGTCLYPSQSSGAFLQARNASQSPIWDAVISINGQGTLRAGVGTSDGRGNVYLLLKFDMSGFFQPSRKLLVEAVGSGRTANTTFPVIVGRETCFGMQISAQGEPNMVFQLDLKGIRGSISCNGLDVDQAGSLISVAGTFAGAMKLRGQRNQWASSSEDDREAGFVMVLATDSRPTNVIVFQLVQVAEQESSIRVQDVALNGETGSVDVVGSVKGYLLAGTGVNSSNANSFHSRPSLFAIRFSIYTSNDRGSFAGQVQWVTSLNMADLTSHATSATSAGKGLVLGGFSKLGDYPMHWLAMQIEAGGRIAWVQQHVSEPLNTWAQDVQIESSGDQLHVLVNRQGTGQATFSDIRVVSLCATTGDVMNRNSLGTVTTVDTEQARSMALSRWKLDGTPCDNRDCTMLVCANIYDTAETASPLEKILSPGDGAFSNIGTSAAWLHVATLQTTQQGRGPWSWLTFVLVFSGGLLAASILAACCFCGVFYGPRAMNSCAGWQSKRSGMRRNESQVTTADSYFHDTMNRIDEAAGSGSVGDWDLPGQKVITASEDVEITNLNKGNDPATMWSASINHHSIPSSHNSGTRSSIDIPVSSAEAEPQGSAFNTPSSTPRGEMRGVPFGEEGGADEDSGRSAEVDLVPITLLPPSPFVERDTSSTSKTTRSYPLDVEQIDLEPAALAFDSEGMQSSDVGESSDAEDFGIDEYGIEHIQKPMKVDYSSRSLQDYVLPALSRNGSGRSPSACQQHPAANGSCSRKDQRTSSLNPTLSDSA